ncbi:hypothetical protein CHARACLAT_025621 [Characodon lateralis]|uniref:Uncharacterized protein n=1 Tax=Characodon lateralis TaxID=208331 RepID=A0ABU7ENZ8_9TELE|nr:hypothetical protein [Characodon lateralis]
MHLEGSTLLITSDGAWSKFLDFLELYFPLQCVLQIQGLRSCMEQTCTSDEFLSIVYYSPYVEATTSWHPKKAWQLSEYFNGLYIVVAMPIMLWHSSSCSKT